MSSEVDWVQAAARLPLGFAQVREDARIDLEVVRRIGRPARVLLVASGGCTAAALAASGEVAALHLVDASRAQIALSRLKLVLLDEGVEDRLRVLGHRAMPAAQRAERLGAFLAGMRLDAEVLGPAEFVARVGPDFAGRYERVFLALQDALADKRDELEALLRLADPARQSALVAEGTALGRALEQAMATVLGLPTLVTVFGEEATRNPVEPFHRHFLRRLRHALATLPAADNPYLWQMLAGRFPDAQASPWLGTPPVSGLPAISWESAAMLEALAHVEGKLDLVHLSNILDWLAPEAARRTLDAASNALRPGGSVLVRQLNSTLDIPSLGPQFRWQDEASRMLHQRDRSFFYRALHWGVRR